MNREAARNRTQPGLLLRVRFGLARGSTGLSLLMSNDIRPASGSACAAEMEALMALLGLCAAHAGREPPD